MQRKALVAIAVTLAAGAAEPAAGVELDTKAVKQIAKPSSSSARCRAPSASSTAGWRSG